jgi:hypothetical protein
MKIHHISRQNQNQPRADITRKTPVHTAIKATLLSAALLLSYLPKAEAKQPAPKSKKCWEGDGRINGSFVTLRGDAGGTVSGCMVYHEKHGGDTAVSVSDPTKLLLDFYPIISKEDFKGDRRRVIEIIYLLNDEIKSFKASVKPVNLELDGFKLPKDLTLGTPVRLPLYDESEEVIAVEHTKLALLGMGGVLIPKDSKGTPIMAQPFPVDIPSLVPVPTEKPSDAKTAEKPVPKQPGKKPPEKEEKPPAVKETIAEGPAKAPEKPEEKAEQPAEKAKRPLLSLAGRRLMLSSLGEFDNRGEINDVELLYLPSINDTIAITLGGYMGHRNIAVTTVDAETAIMLTSGGGVAGLRLRFGDHTVFADVFGGIRHVLPRFKSKNDASRRSEYAEMQAEFGGRVGYDFDDMFGLVLLGSNNPFTVGQLRAYASLPYTWTPGDHLRVDVDARWLHLIKPNTGERMGGTLDQGNILFDTTVKIPTYRLWGVLPSAMVGFSWNKDLGNSNGIEADASNIYLGATVDALIADTVRVELGGAYMFTGDYMLILNASLLH